MKHILTALILILCLAAAVLVPAAAEEDSPARPLVERIVVSHAADGTRDEQALAAPCRARFPAESERHDAG